jgi:tRNA(Ile)-lysidine synthetase-like protein
MEPQLQLAIDSVPTGRWAIGVSGGADSVALLRLMLTRSDIALHVAHLNHQTRGDESDGDAAFVKSLAADHQLPYTIARRDEIEPTVPSLPSNTSSRYRLLRQLLFRSVIRKHDLKGVLLAHHADDQAETILQRLLRGSGPIGLCCMSSVVELHGLTIARPLLEIRSALLRQYLNEVNQNWREDASNGSDAYQRNRLRRLLKSDPAMAATLLTMGKAARELRNWIDRSAKALPDEFTMRELLDQPKILARRSAAVWLQDHGVPSGELMPPVIDRLIAMASDAASASRVTFPGNIQVQRRRGRISVCQPAAYRQSIASPSPSTPMRHADQCALPAAGNAAHHRVSPA